MAIVLGGTVTGTESCLYISNAEIFGTWITDSTASTTISNCIWHDWHDIGTVGTVSCITTTESTSNEIIWTQFVDNHNRIIHVREMDEQRIREAQEREEQRQVAARERAKKYDEERKAAQLKAQLILKESLTNVQRIQLEKYGYFFVQGNHSGKTYRIRNGRSANIDLMDGKRVVQRLCAHPEEYCPNEDTMLVQKIWLEHMEQEFLHKAIRH